MVIEVLAGCGRVRVGPTPALGNAPPRASSEKAASRTAVRRRVRPSAGKATGRASDHPGRPEALLLSAR